MPPAPFAPRSFSATLRNGRRQSRVGAQKQYSWRSNQRDSPDGCHHSEQPAAAANCAASSAAWRKRQRVALLPCAVRPVWTTVLRAAHRASWIPCPPHRLLLNDPLWFAPLTFFVRSAPRSSCMVSGTPLSLLRRVALLATFEKQISVSVCVSEIVRAKCTSVDLRRELL